MKDLAQFIIESIVKNPKDVTVNEKVTNGEVNLEVVVNPEDIGLVIGKGGKIIKSIRSIIRTKAILENKKVNILLVE